MIFENTFWGFGFNIVSGVSVLTVVGLLYKFIIKYHTIELNQKAIKKIDEKLNEVNNNINNNINNLRQEFKKELNNNIDRVSDNINNLRQEFKKELNNNIDRVSDNINNLNKDVGAIGGKLDIIKQGLDIKPKKRNKRK